MCSIIGILSRGGQDVSEPAQKMLSTIFHRGPEGCGFVSDTGSGNAKKATALQIPNSQVLLGNCLLSTTGYAPQPVVLDDFSCALNGEIYNYGEFMVGKEKFISDSVVLAKYLEKSVKQNGIQNAVRALMEKAIGEFSVGFMHKGTLFAFRDFTGQKPLWFGSGKDMHAFASEQEALIAIGIDSAQALLPGHLLTLTKQGFATEKIFDLADFRKTIPTKHSVQILKEEFVNAVDLQTRNLKNAAVLFSGGVDSSLVAKAVSQKINVKCFVAGVAGSHDIQGAKRGAKELGLELVAVELSEADVKSLAQECIGRLGGFDSMQVAIAIPLLACAKAIAKEKIKVVFSGQGSDEIFCGYSSYSETLKSNGYAGVEAEIWSALERMPSRNFSRDDLMISGEGLELRLPFFARNFLEQAMAFPAQEKVLAQTDSLRKHPVRALAEEFGVSKEIALKPKKALQYGSGVQKIVSKLYPHKT